MSRLLERLPSLPLLEEAGLPSLSPVPSLMQLRPFQNPFLNRLRLRDLRSDPSQSAVPFRLALRLISQDAYVQIRLVLITQRLPVQQTPYLPSTFVEAAPEVSECWAGKRIYRVTKVRRCCLPYGVLFYHASTAAFTTPKEQTAVR